MNIVKKIKKMNHIEIINLMLDSIENPTIPLYFPTYLKHNKENNLCYGCAATNALLRLNPISYDSVNEFSKHKATLSDMFDEDKDYLRNFEMAINQLRLCNFKNYNVIADGMSFRSRFITGHKFASIPDEHLDILSKNLQYEYRFEEDVDLKATIAKWRSVVKLLN